MTPSSAALAFPEWLDGADYAPAYVSRTFPPCVTCPAREEARAPLMRQHLALRRASAPATVRLLLIAESPPWSRPGAAVRHFYNPASPHPDNLFRATAAALLDDDRPRWSAAEKAAALSQLVARGFLLLDSAKCPVNHLAPRDRRAALRACASHVLRAELSRLRLAPDAAICMVVRTTVPPASVPVLAALGLRPRLVEPAGLPFPGRWPHHRERFIDTLRAVAAGTHRP